jgi:hypothetical protein
LTEFYNSFTEASDFVSISLLGVVEREAGFSFGFLRMGSTFWSDFFTRGDLLGLAR